MGRVWFAKDADFLSDPVVVELGERHGPGGPLVIDALLGLCKLARGGGRVTVGHAALARRAFIDVDLCRAILRDAAEFGLLEVDEVGPVKCEVRFPQWGKWQDAYRKAAKRARDPAPDNSGHQPDNSGHEPDGPVRATGTETNDRTTEGSSLRSDPVEPGLDVARDLFAYWQQQCGHPQAKLTRDRERKIRSRLREGYTPDQIRVAINGAASGAFENDQGKRFDDIELICRNGSKLESFIDRAGSSVESDSAAFIDRLNRGGAAA